MKWFFCWCEDTDFRTDHNWRDLIRVSVESARRSTTLEPNFIYDGEPSDFTAELSAEGVNVIFHRLSFTNAISDHCPSDTHWQAVARGAFLRFDIPLVAENDDEFVLYTDADVIFQSDPTLTGYVPTFLAAAPQIARGAKGDMNSGVMLLNLKTFRNIQKYLISFTRANLHLGLDQDILREFVSQDYLLLPDIYNWKPYWGINRDAPILHWHGPKPEAIGGLLDGSNRRTHDSWQALFEKDPNSYAYYFYAHQELLLSYNTNRSQSTTRKQNISRGKTVTHSSHSRWLSIPMAESITSSRGEKQHTHDFRDKIQYNPWWQIDLGDIATITEIRVQYDSEAGKDEVTDFNLSISIEGNVWVDLTARKRDDGITESYTWAGPGTAWSRYVRVTFPGRNYQNLRCFDVFGNLP
jgi:hypothetical protein